MEFILYLLLIAAFIFSIFTSFNVKGTFRKYNKMPSSRGVSAADIARQILDSNGLYNVQVTRVSGELTDHYDPRTNTVALSAPVYDSVSVGAIGVAAHEVGHAIQYAENYTPIRIRMAILPVAQFGSSAWILFFILGIVFNMPILRGIGIGLFAAIVLFQLITLPVEFNASRRALSVLESEGIVSSDEKSGVRKVLWAAAMTYVAALFVSLANLLRILIIVMGGRNRRR